MNWLSLVIVGHLINALAFILTKFLLDKHIKNATVFAILIGLLGMSAFLLFPFGLVMPTGFQLLIDLVAGAVLLGALLVFNYALKNYDISSVVPISGGAVPVFTWLLAFLFLGELLMPFEIIAFGLLLVGTVVLANEGGKKKKFSVKMAGLSLFSGFLFALSFVLSKYAFEIQPFISGYIWIRLGSFLVALLLLLKPKNCKETLKLIQKTSWAVKSSFVGSLVLGGLGYTLINYAISTGSVTLVNALQGVQYAFLLILVLLISKFAPKLLKEKYSRAILIKKIVGILMISGGILVLAFL